MAGRTLREKRETNPPRNADSLPRSPFASASASTSASTSTYSSESSTNDATKEKLAMEQRLTGKMFSYEIVCFLLAITFTALAALHSSPSKISKPPAARPFFEQNSLVLDFYKGHLGAMIERVAQADFSFVMYYAPWDADSQALRREFDDVARFYRSQIFFAAINCWHPDSECRAQYNKIHGYPVLMLYPSRDSGINYRGIRTAPYMIRFLHAVMNPIVRVINREEIEDLLVTYDAVVLGYFNFTRLDKTPGYREFYKAAVRSLERDPNRELVFAIVTSASSSKLDYGVYKFPSASLLVWNESLTYPENSEWTSENILNWIGSSIHQPSLWLQPPGVKAHTLAPYLREGPVLFLFTPRNPLHAENYIYNLVKEIGLRYYNCANNILVKNIVARLEAKRRTAVARHFSLSRQCSDLLSSSRSHIEPTNESVSSVSIQRWINDSCCANVAMNKCTSYETIRMNLLEKHMCAAASEKLDGTCKDTDLFTAPLKVRHCGQQFSAYKKNHAATIPREKLRRIHSAVEDEASFTMKENDPRSASMVKKSFLTDKCRRWLAGNSYHPSLFPRDFPNRSNIDLKGSVCKSNKTLALIAIDSLHYFHFAEHLGIDISKEKNQTAVVIVDAALESQYVMHHDFGEYALINFINNYTQGLSQRTLRSDNSQRYPRHNGSNVNSRSKIRVPELTTETFLQTILDPSKDVVIMYHSPYCGFCNAISYVYLTVAHYLSNMNRLTFVRVDGDNNDLPWEYSMNRFPSILFFPAKGKDDSTVFPFSAPITIPNVLNFVLANLDDDSHVEALTNICQLQIGEASDKCIARTRWLCLDIIEQLLRDYGRLRRHSNALDKKTLRNKRKLILLKLEHMKDIHFILGSTVDLAKDREKAQSIAKKFRKYYKLVKSFETTDKTAERRHYKSKKLVQTRMAKEKIVRNEL